MISANDSQGATNPRSNGPGDSVRDRNGFQARMQRIEELTRTLEGLADPVARESARKLMQAILDLHGAGLARILELIARRDGAGRSTVEEIAADELAGSLLLLHGLHPVDPETRVRRALDAVRPVLAPHSADVELLAVSGDRIRLLLHSGGCDAIDRLKLAVEEAILNAAPDAGPIDIQTLGPDGRLSLPVIARPA